MQEVRQRKKNNPGVQPRDIANPPIQKETEFFLDFDQTKLGLKVRPGPREIGLEVASITPEAPSFVHERVSEGMQILQVNEHDLRTMQFTEAVKLFASLTLPIKVKFRSHGPAPYKPQIHAHKHHHHRSDDGSGCCVGCSLFGFAVFFCFMVYVSMNGFPSPSNLPNPVRWIRHLNEIRLEQNRHFHQHNQHQTAPRKQQSNRRLLDDHDFFNFGGPQPERRLIKVDVTLADVYKGSTLLIHDHGLYRKCQHCHGTGAFNGDLSNIGTCPRCGGHGQVIEQVRMAGFVQRFQTQCDECGGTGRIIRNPCPYCGGRRVTDHSHEPVEYTVPRGIKTGEQIIVQQQGDHYPDAHPGDLVVEFNVLKHPRFNREGMDLHYTLPITLEQSLFGFEKTIKHLDGRTVSVKVPKLRNSRSEYVLNGEGLSDDETGQIGKLVVHFDIKLPTEITQDQKL